MIATDDIATLIEEVRALRAEVKEAQREMYAAEEVASQHGKRWSQAQERLTELEKRLMSTVSMATKLPGDE